jgi:hypothetical protein
LNGFQYLILTNSGSLTSERSLELVAKKLDMYGLTLENDIICIITDGASVMTKMGRLSPTYHQLCFAHGVQLAVLDILYKRQVNSSSSETQSMENNSDSEDDDELEDGEQTLFQTTNNEEAEITHQLIGPLIDKTRKKSSNCSEDRL